MKWTKIILLQLIIAVVTALAAGLLGGVHAGISSILAGLSYVIPNIMMFSGLYLNDHLLKKSKASAFFILEFVKISLTLVLVIAVFWLYKDVNWLFFSVSFVISLKSYIFLLFRHKN
ncbi:MAG: ATP synthase subunit I [Betaproteobacteria bacterium]|nr:ATP synthase subunit I [Betaproteobacteria bacterium]